MDNKKNNEGEVKPQSEQLPKTLSKWEESLFQSSPHDFYTYRKAEKICSAIHFVTNFFNEKEPLRLTLREKSIDLLSLSLSFIRNADLPALLSSMSIRLIEIKAFLQTAFFSGLVSEMNFNIIKDELDKLLSIIESKRQTLFALPTSYLQVAMPEVVLDDIGQSIGQKSQTISNVSYNKTRNNIQNQSKNLPAQAGKIKSDGSVSERTLKILALLKDGKERTIKDFSDSIKGCSEKTLQRELIRLVSFGQIIKKGERRWSRYSIG